MSGNLQADRYLDFIAALRSFRVQIGVTQVALAERLGRPQSFVSKTERLERRLDIVEFIDWAAALDQEPEVLLRTLRDWATSDRDASVVDP